ncbi:hypothetical protein [Ruminococcus sp.]|uniref:hypothetical protein n=1 Tax=Ruminococcus sp. TaxID=41978 RepID=UPI00260F2EC6|nr:hypothetical protein [Ruminococcus sp.]MDD7555392.1 hypothetical protein [Ruminococcus sp.]MDY4963928.1 hypothetical protein [Ruminococcus callidus]
MMILCCFGERMMKISALDARVLILRKQDDLSVPHAAYLFAGQELCIQRMPIQNMCKTGKNPLGNSEYSMPDGFAHHLPTVFRHITQKSLETGWCSCAVSMQSDKKTVQQLPHRLYAVLPLKKFMNCATIFLYESIVQSIRRKNNEREKNHEAPAEGSGTVRRYAGGSALSAGGGFPDGSFCQRSRHSIRRI